ncbi:MAG: hypothetical protein LBT96_00385 [Campylobacteraceae bacterium]|jgi:hypothetical protein|nr:hypothetical protein [Campylobacteraceae bacterium]
MRTKKIFAVLTMLFTLFALTGCKENGSNEGNVSSSSSEKSKNNPNSEKSKSGSSVKGALTSVSEWDYFPKLDIQDRDSYIIHAIQIFYKSEAEQMSDVEAFKNKGSYDENSVNSFHRQLNKKTALEQAWVIPIMFKEGYYINNMHLVGTLGETTARDNVLFEKLFGYKGGTLIGISVSKVFQKNIAAKLQQYSALLEQQGFKKSNTREWRKIDADNNRIYTWSYSVTTTKGGFISQGVHWHVASTDNDC